MTFYIHAASFVVNEKMESHEIELPQNWAKEYSESLFTVSLLVCSDIFD